jgi:hypothetical protein
LHVEQGEDSRSWFQPANQEPNHGVSPAFTAMTTSCSLGTAEGRPGEIPLVRPRQFNAYQASLGGPMWILRLVVAIGAVATTLASCSLSDCAYYGNPDSSVRCVITGPNPRGSNGP